jgi:hypothetical protein
MEGRGGEASSPAFPEPGTLREPHYTASLRPFPAGATLAPKPLPSSPRIWLGLLSPDSDCVACLEDPSIATLPNRALLPSHPLRASPGRAICCFALAPNAGARRWTAWCAPYLAAPHSFVDSGGLLQMWEHLWIHSAGRGHKGAKMWGRGGRHILGTNRQMWKNVGRRRKRRLQIMSWEQTEQPPKKLLILIRSCQLPVHTSTRGGAQAQMDDICMSPPHTHPPHFPLALLPDGR